MVNHIKRYLIAGVLIVLPTFLTISIIYRLFTIIDNVLKPLLGDYLGYTLPGLGFIVLLLLIFFVGMIASNFLGRRLVHAWEATFRRVPLVSRLFTVIREISHSLLGEDNMLFSQVVLIEYPSPGLYGLGLLTREAKDNLFSERLNCPMVNVFLPTAPNPTSGLIVVIPATKIIPLELSIEEAMKFVMSAGALMPDSFEKKAGIADSKNKGKTA